MIHDPTATSNGHSEHHYFMAVQVMTPQGPAIVNIIANKHPALVMLEMHEKRQMFVIHFYQEITPEMARTVNDGINALNAERAPLIMPHR